MSLFKSIAVIGLLGALSLAVYYKMNKSLEPVPPDECPESWLPDVDMGGMGFDEGTPGVPAMPPLPAVVPTEPLADKGSSDSSGTATRDAAPGRDPPMVPVSPPAPAAYPAPLAGPASRAVESVYPSGGADPRALPGPPRHGGAGAAISAAVPNATATAFAETRTAVQGMLDRGALSQALLLLSRWYGDSSLLPSEQAELTCLLSQLAGTVVYSTEHHVEPAYVVKVGDTLQTIAHEYRVPWQLLAKINGMAESEQLKPGQELKVLRGPFSAILSLARRELTLKVGGYYAGRFSVGIGAERQDMEGRWEVKHKLTNPTYYGRDRVIDADDSSNPLGEHWIGLASATQESTVEPFGIHGTYDAQSISRGDTRGYIRLAPQDARDVYDILSIGSKVVIRR